MPGHIPSVFNGAAASFPVVPVAIVGSIFIWAVSGLLLYRIGNKLGYERSWYAWIPFLFVYMMVELSNQEKSWFWFIVIMAFIPCISIISLVMLVIVIMDISEKCGKPRWWGILWLVPVVIWVVMFVTGNGDAPAQTPSQPTMPTGELPTQQMPR